MSNVEAQPEIELLLDQVFIYLDAIQIPIGPPLSEIEVQLDGVSKDLSLVEDPQEILKYEQSLRELDDKPTQP